jgi:hypothetical protein
MTKAANPTKSQIVDLLIEAGAAKGEKKAMMRESKEQLLTWLEEIVIAGNAPAPAETSEVPEASQKALAKAETIAQKIRSFGFSALARYACDDASRVVITGGSVEGATYELHFNGIAFAYGPSTFKPFEGNARKVRNVSELLRLVSA